MKPETRGRRIRVAAFLLVTVAVMSLLIILIGRSTSLFGRKATLHTVFVNTSGLIAGASVRLAGVDIGIVHSIRIDPDPTRKRVAVELSVADEYLERIGTDSVAQINSKGLLGDMVVNITLGSADKPHLKDGDSIDSSEATGLTMVIESVQDAIAKVNLLVTDVDGRLKEVLTPQVAADVGRLAHSSADVMEGVLNGPGLVHKLIYEPAMARDAEQVLGDVKHVVERINGAVGEADRVLAEVRTGDGLLHGLVYEKGGGQIVARLDRAAGDLAAVVGEVQSGHGMLHSLVYDQEREDLVKNLTEASRIVRHLAEETEQGKGTIGGLLKDPTVYEDLTTVLDKVKRNQLLKALVRYTIVQDGMRATGRTEPVAAEKTGR